MQEENKKLINEKDESLIKKDHTIGRIKREINEKSIMINELNSKIDNYIHLINEKDNILKQKEEIITDLKNKIEDKVNSGNIPLQEKQSPVLIVEEFIERISKIDNCNTKLRVPINDFKQKFYALNKCTMESGQQTIPCIFDNEKMKTSNFKFELVAILVKSVNQMMSSDKEVLAKQDIIFHQLMKQKAVFEIEKLVYMMNLLRFSIIN